MEKNYHFIKQRLENLKTIKPMLMSLRTISLSSWRLSLKRLENLESYRRDLTSVAAQVGALPTAQPNEEKVDSCLIILGSTRGLCGGFNRDLLAYFEEHPAELEGTTEIILFGEKMAKLFSRNHIAYQRTIEYPKINRIDFQFIAQLIANLSCDNKPLRILYNTYHGSGQYQPSLRLVNWIHNSAPKPAATGQNLIFDTEPSTISEYLSRQINLMEIYESLLSSLAAEHSFRFQLMENAISNTDKLIQELGLMVQVERQKKITSEMRELSISAGLLDR
ncbi:F0F1 ATP synthase subunit gamma [Pelolinea submarina]|uniref:ATP synthase F1 gamma subunit n=1 Tax=Pelolinea submarina TaxID=913107 RepID=A0A347ZV59_9CHLR|nr:F0F1 ATP synthase subunit gamma [Pelolinea submarina]REG10224.1 ATP synthase F1 gamma subunit [Pelolinea submarina]BBB49190.1 F-type H+-transporting ATPase subunit gamma [Pelolinea submarina]